MNAMDGTPEQGPEAEIILIGIDGKSYYMYKGEEHLSQVLLVDGTFPKPILCVNFETMIDAARVMGAEFKLSDFWSVHPDIIARLRESKFLVETNA